MTFVGGNFMAAFGNPFANHLTHSPFSPAPAVDTQVFGVVLDIEPAREMGNDVLFFGGVFPATYSSGHAVVFDNIGKLDATGLSLNAGNADGPVWDLERNPPSLTSWPVSVVAIGGFDALSGSASRGMAWFGDDGSGTPSWWPLGSGLGIAGTGKASAFVVRSPGNAQVQVLVEETCLMIGGTFTSLDGVLADSIGEYCCDPFAVQLPL